MKEYKAQMLKDGNWLSLTHADGHHMNANKPFTSKEQAVGRINEIIAEREAKGKQADGYRLVERDVTDWTEVTP